MPLVRLSPSGPPLVVELESDAIENQSIVPGDTLTEALDYLFTANQFQIFDEFLGGTSTTLVASTDGGIGELGWSFVTSGGQLARPASGDYIGAYQLTANASQISGVLPGPAGGGASATFPIANITFVEWFGVPNLTSSLIGTTRFGIGVDPSLSQFGADGIFFEAAAATSPNWRCTARRSSVNTTVTTSVPWSILTPTRLTLTRNDTDGSWRFFINNDLVQTVTALQAPIQRMNGMAQVVAAAGGPQDAVVDTFKLNYDR